MLSYKPGTVPDLARLQDFQVPHLMAVDAFGIVHHADTQLYVCRYVCLSPNVDVR